MVDAIGSVSAQQIKPSKKDDSINWKGCTSDEIIEYEQQGQEVPDYILQWAKEIAKLENAPEDITYEMAMGATSMNAINQNQVTTGQNVDNTELDEGNVQGTNTAIAIRERLGQQGATIFEQAKAFRGYSNQYTDELNNLMDTMETYLAQAAAAENQAQEAKDGVLSRIQSLISSKKDLKRGDVASAVESARIDREIQTVGRTGLSTVEATAIPIDNTAQTILNGQFTSLTGRQFGEQTVDIGKQINQNYSGFWGFTGYPTIKVGQKEIKTSNAADNHFAQDSEENNAFSAQVGTYKSEITQASGAVSSSENQDSETEDAEEKAESNNTVQDTEQDEVAKQSESKQEDIAQQEPETVDEKLLTDPNEILKRKMKKGLT